jgi:hypothetical protein
MVFLDDDELVLFLLSMVALSLVVGSDLVITSRGQLLLIQRIAHSIIYSSRELIVHTLTVSVWTVPLSIIYSPPSTPGGNML